jgi:hypothetical protein
LANKSLHKNPSLNLSLILTMNHDIHTHESYKLSAYKKITVEYLPVIFF